MVKQQQTPPEITHSAAFPSSIAPRPSGPYGVGQDLERRERATASLEALSGALARHQTASTVAAEQVALRFRNAWDARCKRVIDVLASIIIPLGLMPVLAICCAVIFIDSPGPIFFKHRRIGLAGKEFYMWKFRSMCHNPEHVLNAHLQQHPEILDEWMRTHKLMNDPRVTPVGRFMRRFSLDELPQFWNVITGEMSLIGPRPIVRDEVAKYGDAMGAYYAVRPGMSGLWQVSGRSDITYEERVKLDAHYSEHWSLAMDAGIFLRTFGAVLKGSGAY